MESAVDKHTFPWRHILCIVCNYSVLPSVIAWLSCVESVQETSSRLLDPANPTPAEESKKTTPVFNLINAFQA